MLWKININTNWKEYRVTPPLSISNNCVNSSSILSFTSTLATIFGISLRIIVSLYFTWNSTSGFKASGYCKRATPGGDLILAGIEWYFLNNLDEKYCTVSPGCLFKCPYSSMIRNKFPMITHWPRKTCMNWWKFLMLLARRF